jgi:copper transport protein
VFAHAVLTHTTPHQGSTVGAAPSAVRLDFNEPVEVSVGAVRVFDTSGARVDAATVEHPGGRQSSVAVDLRDRLGRGVYTATYRVVSADGHPVSGGFSFGVGQPVATARDAPEVADLLARSQAGPAVEGAYGVARGLHYGALLLLVGALFFAAFVWPAGSSRQWPVRALVVASILGALSAFAGLLLQGALAAGVALGEALSAPVLDAATSTRAGQAWALRAGAWAVVLAVLAILPGRPGRLGGPALALPLAALVGSLPYAGHADTHSPKALLIPADVLHVLAAGAWLGALVLLLAVFWPRRSEQPGDGAAEATARFSRLALPAVIALVAGGLAQTWFYLGGISGIVSTPYTWALFIKVMLLGAVVALAARNRRRVGRLLAATPADSGALRRSMRAEVGLAVLVLAATATLVRAEPPVTLASGPVVRELDVGPMRLRMDIEPAKVGANDYHLYFFDRRTGAQVDRVEEVTVRLTQPEKEIGPIELTIPRKSVAHYELLAAPLGVPGSWRAQVDVRVSDFDQYTARTEFDVR